MRGRQRLLLIGGVVLLLFALAAWPIWAAVSSPHVPAFYDPPSPLPEGAPGDLIRWEEANGPEGHRVWRILYQSRDLNDEPIAISGLIAIPDEPPPEEGYPLVAVAHGTTGIARGCAPSLLLETSFGFESGYYDHELKPFLDAGYAVVGTDYQGLGAPGDPSYVIGELEGRNVLDAIRAARQFPEIALSDRLLMRGHSQGGHAAAFASQMAASYAPELEIEGVALVAPATDMTGMFETIIDENRRSPNTALALMVAGAWGRTYPEANLDEVTTRLGRRMIERVTDEYCLTISALASLIVPPDRLMLPEALELWADLLAVNTPEGVRTDMPYFVAQGEEDPVILPVFTGEYVDRLCANGNTVDYRLYPGADHFTVVEPSEPEILAWFAARLDGEPAPSNCGDEETEGSRRETVDSGV